MVPTVERGLEPTVFWSMDTTGDRPLTKSTSGFFSCPTNRFAKVDIDASRAPLPFGIERVEGERRLAGPAHAGDDDELVARDLDVDVRASPSKQIVTSGQFARMTSFGERSHGCRLDGSMI